MSSSGSGRSRRFSRCRRSVSTALRSASSTRSRCSGFSRKSNAPRRVASTAVAMSPCPLITTTGSSTPRSRNARSTSSPSISGILTSRNMAFQRAFGGPRQRLAARRRLLDPVALVLEDHAQAVADRGLVVDHEDRAPCAPRDRGRGSARSFTRVWSRALGVRWTCAYGTLTTAKKRLRVLVAVGPHDVEAGEATRLDLGHGALELGDVGDRLAVDLDDDVARLAPLRRSAGSTPRPSVIHTPSSALGQAVHLAQPGSQVLVLEAQPLGLALAALGRARRRPASPSGRSSSVTVALIVLPLRR